MGRLKHQVGYCPCVFTLMSPCDQLSQAFPPHTRILQVIKEGRWEWSGSGTHLLVALREFMAEVT